MDEENEILVIEEKAAQLLPRAIEGSQKWDKNAIKIQNDTTKVVVLMLQALKRSMAQLRDFDPYTPCVEPVSGQCAEIRHLWHMARSMFRYQELARSQSDEENRIKYERLVLDAQKIIVKSHSEYIDQIADTIKICIKLMNDVSDRQEKARQHDERMKKDVSQLTDEELERLASLGQ